MTCIATIGSRNILVRAIQKNWKEKKGRKIVMNKMKKKEKRFATHTSTTFNVMLFDINAYAKLK